MPTTRRGNTDALLVSRLNFFTGTTHPAAPTTLYLGVFAGAMPLSDGTGGTEVSPASRPVITLGAPATDANGRHYITNAAAVTGIVLTNTSPAEIVGFGLFTAASAGTLYYSDTLPSPFRVNALATISIPAGAIKVYAEPPTI